MDETAFRATFYASLPGWAEADHALALGAFRLSAERLLGRAVREGGLGIRPDAFLSAANAALDARPVEARGFFEAHFAPALIRPEGARGFTTGYFEPELEASRSAVDGFTVPLHARPSDLVAVHASNRPAGFDPAYAFARKGADGTLAPFADRAAIARGALHGQGLEIAFLASEIDAFFVHVQGSARLRLRDGSSLRVGYAGKSGHPYTAIGRVLVASGELTLEEADMAGLRRWLAANPSRVREILDHNRSYIFFEAREISDETLGPVGAAGVPLTAGASIALDHRLHTFGMPVFLDAPALRIGERPFRQLLVAQDTGSAIVGPARGDIFVGSGERAGALAGTIRHAADFYALLPVALHRRLGP